MGQTQKGFVRETLQDELLNLSDGWSTTVRCSELHIKASRELGL